MKNAIISGSFDPITIGHIDLIVRASNLFDHLYIAIGNNPDKTYVFPVECRKQFISNAVHFLKNVTVVVFDGLLAEFAYSNSIDYIVRGVRNANDLQYEITLDVVNNKIHEMETIFIPTKPQLQHISSSVVKAIAKEYGNVLDYTTLMVKSHIERIMWKKHILCLVGISGSGKSYIGQKLCELSNDISFINLDKIAHAIYESNEPYAIKIKDQLVRYFGRNVINEDGIVNRRYLGSIVFSDKNALNLLNLILSPAMKHSIYNHIRKSTSKYIIFEGAIIPENGFLPLFNNHVILLNCNVENAMRRAAKRDNISISDIQKRYNSQATTEEKRLLIHQSIAKENYGNLIEFNSDDGMSDDEIHGLIEKIKKKCE